MSILVKGMKMPRTCIECPMQFGGFCGVQPADVDESRVFPTVDECWEKGKPEWCPLSEFDENEIYKQGFDDGRKHEWTLITAFRESGKEQT